MRTARLPNALQELSTGSCGQPACHGTQERCDRRSVRRVGHRQMWAARLPDALQGLPNSRGGQPDYRGFCGDDGIAVFGTGLCGFIMRLRCILIVMAVATHDFDCDGFQGCSDSLLREDHQCEQQRHEDRRALGLTVVPILSTMSRQARRSTGRQRGKKLVGTKPQWATRGQRRQAQRRGKVRPAAEMCRPSLSSFRSFRNSKTDT